MSEAFLWSLAGLLFVGAWAFKHYGEAGPAAEFAAHGLLCVVVALVCGE